MKWVRKGWIGAAVTKILSQVMFKEEDFVAKLTKGMVPYQTKNGKNSAIITFKTVSIFRCVTVHFACPCIYCHRKA
jgi:hypothetical protein